MRTRRIEQIKLRVIESNDLYWLAGLLEGEGCFYIGDDNKGVRRRKIRVEIRMTDKDVIDRVANLFETHITIYRRPAFKSLKTAWFTAVTGTKAIQLMRLLRPHMGIRRRAKIDEILAYWDNYYGIEVKSAS